MNTSSASNSNNNTSSHDLFFSSTNYEINQSIIKYQIDELNNVLDKLPIDDKNNISYRPCHILYNILHENISKYEKEMKDLNINIKEFFDIISNDLIEYIEHSDDIISEYKNNSNSNNNINLDVHSLKKLTDMAKKDNKYDEDKREIYENYQSFIKKNETIMNNPKTLIYLLEYILEKNILLYKSKKIFIPFIFDKDLFFNINIVSSFGKYFVKNLNPMLHVYINMIKSGFVYKDVKINAMNLVSSEKIGEQKKLRDYNNYSIITYLLSHQY